MSIYKTQTFAPIVLDAGINISAASTRRIYYKKPSGKVDFWEAELEGSTKLKFQPTSPNDLDEEGVWEVHGYCVIGGRDAFTKKARFNVETPLKL